MADYHLPVYELQALAVITELRPDAAAGVLDAGGCTRLATAYRIAAACSALLRMDAAQTNAWLQCSGQAFLAATAGSPYRGPATGRVCALRDALAAGDLALARMIAARLPTVMREDEEFPDEFHVQRFLITRFLFPDVAAATTHLAALAACDEAAERGLFAICDAFQRTDQPSFAEGMTDLLRWHRTYYADLMRREAAPDNELCTVGAICIDGLALVRLARIASIATVDQYPLIPGFVLAASPAVLPVDAWLQAPPAE